MTTSKYVPKRRFSGFDGEWKEIKLYEVVQDFIVPMRDKPKEFSGNIPWTRIDDIEGKYISRSLKGHCVSLETVKRMNLKIIPEDSLIVSASATFGTVAIVKNDLITNQTFIGLVPKNKYEVEFLFYLFQSPKVRNYMKEESAGSTIFYISRESFEKMEINLPDEKERKLISKQLCTIDSLISLHQHKLDKLKNLKKAYLSEMFPAEGERVPKRRFPGFEGEWEQTRLGDIAERFDNLRVPVASKDRVSGTIPYYGANGIQDYVDGFTHNGEFVLLAEDGANDLKNYPVHYVKGKIWVNNHAHVIQGKEDLIDNQFLLFAVKQIQIEPYLVGGGRAKLNADIMMDLPLIIPEISEQKSIGSFLMTLDKRITLQQQKLDKLNDLKKAYLNELFV